MILRILNPNMSDPHTFGTTPALPIGGRTGYFICVSLAVRAQEVPSNAVGLKR
jgi:hypothetical protein